MPILQLISKTSLGPAATYAIDHSQIQSIAPLKLGVVPLKNSSLGSSSSCSYPKGHSGWSLRLDIDKPSSKINYSLSMKDASFQRLKKLNTSREKSLEYISHDLNGKLQTEVYSGSGLVKISVGVCGKELERRRKIGLANKGRTPWNKGIKHSEETRMRIKKRTIEALKDPKVRKKMSERPHSHSDQSKARISFSLRRFWHESLKHKRLQEKLYFSWARYIAEAAKRGGDDQRELGWDSFQKIKADINFQYLQEREEKALARETAKLIAEKVARDRAANNAQKRKKKEEQAKTKSLLRQNLLNRKKKNDLARDLKLIERLAKIQYSKRRLNIPVSRRRASSVGSQPSVENLDLEFIKEEKLQRSNSLADQLQTLKGKKFEVCVQLL
ncbi:uncharacterized protein LOC110092273 isoform X1 [Dendrobium catenatum]|uniref:uncharacterized protein LOC110092273 isoform X1 n=1 Tax=Dendrobium catenatum TaxID=906689 RepID=UPI0009F712A4|nr:uncharacterized protein LOC110092273 isoform X1 [Dendrobium catenatum]